jgi:hypothetical protein
LVTEQLFSGGWQRLLGPEESKAGDTLKAQYTINLGHA